MCNVISFQHYMCFHVDIQILIIGHIACCFHFVMYTYDVFSNNIPCFFFLSELFTIFPCSSLYKCQGAFRS